MKKITEKGDLSWDWFDETFCTEGVGLHREPDVPPLAGRQEIFQSYLECCESIIRNISFLRALVCEMGSADAADPDKTDVDAESSELLSELLANLVIVEESISDSVQLANDLTTLDYEAEDYFHELPLRSCYEEFIRDR